MILTDLERLLLGFTGCSAAVVLAGFAIDDRLRRRSATAGWTRAAKGLGRRITMEAQAREHAESLAAAAHQQLASHVGHLAAEVERLRAQLATRPPSAADTTVRLGPAAAGRTARLARVEIPDGLPWFDAETGRALQNGSAS